MNALQSKRRSPKRTVRARVPKHKSLFQGTLTWLRLISIGGATMLAQIAAVIGAVARRSASRDRFHQQATYLAICAEARRLRRQGWLDDDIVGALVLDDAGLLADAVKRLGMPRPE